ncbi:hypothetical protein J4405_01115 [Candidatus Woesearchaeota archaeon]|nr:hypothetical protein [Candidatus Woesearchaeota archaeon]
MNKKGEMQMYETILVLFVFFIIIGILLIVFNRYNAGSIQEMNYKFDRDRAFNLLVSLPGSEYMDYTYLGSSKGVIDSSKLLGINLGLRNMEIIVSEYSNRTIRCSKGNYPNCNEYLVNSNIPKKVSSKQEISRSVLIYNPFTKMNNPGKIMVRWYS